MVEITTPAQVVSQLRKLSREIETSTTDLIDVEFEYHNVKAEYEISIAKSRIRLASQSAPNGKNYTVAEREDLALIENEEIHRKMATVEAKVRAVRAKSAALKTQVDIVRSVGSSVKSSMEIL